MGRKTQTPKEPNGKVQHRGPPPGVCVRLRILGVCILGTKPIKILSLGDMHLTNQPSVAYPRKVIEAMNVEGGDLVLVCGDLASKPTRPGRRDADTQESTRGIFCLSL